MKQIKLLITAIFILGVQSLNAQTIADFETPETTPALSAEGTTNVVDNPDKSGINTSDKVGYYKKIEGNWRYVTLDYSTNPIDVSYNNSLTFKVYTSSKGRVYAKFWDGDKVLAEEWAPEWGFMPEPNTWVECRMDLSEGMWGSFSQLQLAICVDNTNLEEADVYFDDVKLSNPEAGDGSPKVIFTASKTMITVGDSIEFDASLSYGYGSELVNYQWNFGDGESATGKKVFHTFLTAQNSTVSLTITDDKNRVSIDSTVVFVFGENDGVSQPVWSSAENYVNEKVEALFQINKEYNNVFNSDEVEVDAIVTMPNGTDITVPCFYFVNSYLSNTNWLIDSSYQGWMLRFSSDKEGEHSVKFRVSDADSVFTSELYTLTIIDSGSKGMVYNDPQNKQYYRHQTGEPFYPLGINIGWNNIDSYTKIISNLSDANANIYRYWHTPFASQALEWSENGFYNGLGKYSQQAAAMTDSLINLSEATDMYMQLVIFQHGMFSENVNEMWEDNPYNTANGGFVDRAEEYFYNDQCKHEAKKLLRYIVARWGYSKNIFAWEFFNEVQFTGIHNSQTSQWFPGVLNWHSEMSQYVQSIDPFNHIMTTSAADNQIPQFDSISALDNIQYHLYSNNMLSDQTELDYHFQHELENLSIINGEYGTNNEADTPFDMQRNSIWNGIMTQTSRYMWIWEHYLQATWASLFTMPASYIDEEDFAKEGDLEAYLFEVTHDSKELTTYGLSNGKNYYGYIYDNANGNNISGAECKLSNLPFANYVVTYYLPESSEVIKIDSIPLIKLTNTLQLPEFSKGIAFKAKYLSAYTLPIAIAGNDTVVAPGVTVSFSGSQSFSQVTGSTLTYQWNIDEKPGGSSLTISDPTSMKIDIIPDVSGMFKVSLVVNDGTNTSAPDVVKITVSNPPVADAGEDTEFIMDTKYFNLDGTNSYDLDGDGLTYKWELVKYPTGSRGNLLNFTKPEAIIEIDEAGDYIAVLVVSDGISSSIPDSIKITAIPSYIDQYGFSDLKIYPNPTKGLLNITSNEEINLIEVYDISARKLLTKKINNSKHVSINLSEIAHEGCILMVKVSNNKKGVFERVIYND